MKIIEIMATLRFQALKEASSRKSVIFEETDRKSIILVPMFLMKKQ